MLRKRIGAIAAKLSNHLYERVPNETYNAGIRYARKGKYDLALEQFAIAQRVYERKLGSFNELTVSTLAYRAHCNGKLSRWDEATKLYERSLQLEVSARGSYTEFARDITKRLKWARERLLEAESHPQSD